MPYSNNRNSYDEILTEKLGNKDSNYKSIVSNPNRAIPRGPYLQYKYNERQLKCSNHLSQLSANFNRNLEGKMEYMRQDIATLAKQGRKFQIDKENDFIENIHATKMGRFDLKRTKKATCEIECRDLFPQDENNLKPSNAFGGACIEPNFIYLKDVIKNKPNGLTESEGWSLLCQSVQALQDLFISSKPSNDSLSIFFNKILFIDITLSSSQILPLIHPDTTRISSRGRVAFDILTSNLVCSYICFLSPEYLSSLDKRCVFLESDMEKVNS